jgi:hypothetical protein
MKTRLIVTGLLGLSLGACASGMKTAWLKDGATRQDFYRDHYSCALRHQPDPHLGPMTGSGRAKELRRACMRVHGWDRVEIPKTRPDGFEEEDD